MIIIIVIVHIQYNLPERYSKATYNFREPANLLALHRILEEF